ncbi:hypothetical protein ACHAXN_004917 [Cyclotella atomus]
MTEQYQPLEQEASSSRSIDDYLEAVYKNSSSSVGRFRHVTNRWRYYVIFLALGIANSGDSAEMGCMNFLLSSEGFQKDILAKDTDDADFAKRGAAIAGAHFAGMLFSGLLFGVLADVRGRRYTLLGGLMCNAILGTLSAFVRNATELCILRFMCGLGLGMVIAGVVTLSAEISPPSCRGRFMTLVASCYTLGFLYTSLSALVIFQAGGGSWRWFMFMNVLPTIVALSLVVMFSNTSSPPLPNTNGLTEGFYLARGRLHESVEVANSLVKRFGISGQDILTEEELRRYLFQANEIGSTSFIAKEAK